MSFRFSILAVLVCLLLFSCSSKKNGQSWAGRVFHNTTSHYNGYYYARLKLTETENSVRASRKEDYQNLLPIYQVGNPGDNIPASDMDSVIKRLTVVVKLHPLSKWADDCYFNIGKSYYYKKDYEAAQATFQFVSSEFKSEPGRSSKGGSSSSSKKKKKKNARDKNVNQYTGTVKEKNAKSGYGLLQHKPVHYTNVIWLIRALAMNRNFGEAQAILSYLETDKEFPSELKDDLYLVQSFVYVQQNQFRNAVEPMEKAIGSTRNKQDKTRYTYILAQLHQLSKDYGTAGRIFTEVSDMKPGYEMDFNARINVVKNYVASGSGAPSQILESLNEMARNRNFAEFNDQIYYYRGLVHVYQNDEAQALVDFETSIARSINNSHQKGLSFLKIGEILLGDQDYMSAASPYDSASVFLDAKFDTLWRVKELSAILNRLTTQTQIVSAEDSLQRIAALPEKERDKLLDQMADRIEKEKRQAEEAAFDPTLVNEPTDVQKNQTSGGTWYFYNTSLRSSGYNEFQKKWGGRENADNWRRSNKKSGTFAEGGEAGEETETDKASNGGTGDSGIREQLLANIPLTEAQMAASNQRIFDAYYEMGRIYDGDLHNLPKAIETFLRMLQRFETHKDIAKVYYNLYLLYERNGNAEQATLYRNKILEESGSSIYASVLRDPDYFRKQEEKMNEVNVYYASTFDYYKSDQFDAVFRRVRSADSLFKPNPIQAKFDLLEALSIGKVKDRNAYINALDSFIVKHPAGEEHDLAVEILTALGAPPKSVQQKQKEQAQKEEKKKKGPSPYQFRQNNPHYLVVAFKTIDPKTKAVSDSLANLNLKNHSLENLKVTSQLLDQKSQMILVKQFPNAGEAIDYFDEVTESETLFDVVESIGYRVFLIDDKNFPLFYQRKDIDEYVDFFEKNYMAFEEEEEEEEDEDSQ